MPRRYRIPVVAGIIEQDDKLLIACGKDSLRLLTLQRPGKKRMSAEECLRGFSLPKGTVLAPL